MAKRLRDDAILVVGLGRFGGALAETLERYGREVLAVEDDAGLVQQWSGRVTHVVQADATNELAMRQVGAADFDIGVIAIGTHIEQSVLATSVLVDIGVEEIWAKAISGPHARILERVGARHVVRPEHETGQRVAHLLSGKIIDFIEFDDGFAIVKIKAPRETFGKTLAESAMRRRYGVTIVGVKTQGQDFTYAQADTVVSAGDLLIVAGRTERVEKFAAETG